MEMLKVVAIGLVTALWSGVTLVQNNCGNEATSPKIGGTAIVSPSALIGLGGGWFWPGEYIS
jgi:hypothetical protein